MNLLCRLGRHRWRWDWSTCVVQDGYVFHPTAMRCARCDVRRGLVAPLRLWG